MSKKHHKKVDRKWFDGRDTGKVKEKLVEAYSKGLSLAEARDFAGVSKSCLSRYLRVNQPFRDRLELLRVRLNMKAKCIVADALNNGDLATAKWWLEHRDDEFKRHPSTKTTKLGLSHEREDETRRVELVIVETEEQAKAFKEGRILPGQKVTQLDFGD